MLRFRSSTPAGHVTVLSIAIALTAGLSGAAQSPATCPPEALPPARAQIAEGMRTARDRGFLWRVSKANRTSYLYGTVHVGRPEWIFPGPEVMEAFRATEVIALELDVLDPDLIRRLQDGMAIRRDHDLPERLNARLRSQLKAACLPEQILTTTSPEIVAATLTMMSARQNGLDPVYD